jgi:hypothetical protein
MTATENNGLQFSGEYSPVKTTPLVGCLLQCRVLSITSYLDFGIVENFCGEWRLVEILIFLKQFSVVL